MKSERRHFYHIYWPLWRQLSLKKCLLVIYKILTLFINTFSADDKFSLSNKENLTEPIQMQLSQKQKKFSRFFSAVWKPRLNFQHLKKKKITHIANVFLKSSTSKKEVISMSKKCCFTVLFNKQHNKCAQKLFKCELRQFHHILWLLET